MASKASADGWTCSRCEVTARSMPGHEPIELPEGWIDEKSGILCLTCRRERAAEAVLDGAAEEMSVQDRARLRRSALLEFEVNRDPSRSDAEIARVMRSSVSSFKKAREDSGLAPAGPPAE
jgi:hypothetical protein